MGQLIQAMGGGLTDNMKSSELCIVDQEKDKKTITDLKKIKKG